MSQQNTELTLESLAANPKKVVLSFSAAWCGPCHQSRPAIEAGAEHYQDRVKTLRVDVDVHPEVARHFNVRGVPTQVLLHRGIELARRSGAVTTTDYEHWLTSNLAES